MGIIVEGAGEVDAIEALLPKINTEAAFVRSPLRADMQPKALNMRVIAKSASTAVNIFRKANVSLVVVLIDREDHPCPVTFASDLTIAFCDMYMDLDFRVVVKDRMIENWLIADPNAFTKLTSRFSVPKGFAAQVANRADAHAAGRLLDSLCLKSRYHKGLDPKRIMERQEPSAMARNSRSFRRFLRVVQEKSYLDQSKKPAT